MPASVAPGKTPRPCGSWPSIFTPALLTQKSVRLSSCRLGDHGTAFFVEGRPNEGGRSALVRRGADGACIDVVPAPFDVRSKVHEYGGGAYEIDGDEAFFVESSTQQIFRTRGAEPPLAITVPGTGWRFGDLVHDARRNRLLCVGEHHPSGSHDATAVINAIVAVSLSDGGLAVLVEGHDFFAHPRLSPDGDRLVWLTWDHPYLPWDAAQLWLAELDATGQPQLPVFLAGSAGASVVAPAFSPGGELYFCHEPEGFWRLYQADPAAAAQPARPVLPAPPPDAEFALPLWQLGMSTWGFLDRDHLAAAFSREGLWSIARIDLRTGTWDVMPSPFTSITHLDARDGKILVIGGAPTMLSSVVLLDAATGLHTVLRSSADLGLSPSELAPFLSHGAPIRFATTAGDHAHAFFYPPRHPEFDVAAGEQPPLLVLAHGGPTAATGNGLATAVQFWTSRGFAVADVNYRGSTGYGRAFRDRLLGQWGVFDVDDCLAVARDLSGRGLVDPRRMVIRGGSAGGFTVLAALVFHDLFAGGASHYGVSDLEALARDTHKFESRYLDRLVAPYPARRDVYQARSPIHHAERLSRPVIFFQGLEDKIVPPNQAEAMADVLRRKKIPLALLTFAGEQHGFRKAETIRAVLDAELAFYGRILGFTPHGPLAPLPIENLPDHHFM